MTHALPTVLTSSSAYEQHDPQTPWRSTGSMGSEKDQFPEVQGGGSLILAWQIKAKNVLVVGGGEVREPLHPKIRPRHHAKL